MRYYEELKEGRAFHSVRAATSYYLQRCWRFLSIGLWARTVLAQPYSRVRCSIARYFFSSNTLFTKLAYASGVGRTVNYEIP